MNKETFKGAGTVSEAMAKYDAVDVYPAWRQRGDKPIMTNYPIMKGAETITDALLELERRNGAYTLVKNGDLFWLVDAEWLEVNAGINSGGRAGLIVFVKH